MDKDKYLRELEGHVHPAILAALRDLDARLKAIEDTFAEPADKSEPATKSKGDKK